MDGVCDFMGLSGLGRDFYHPCEHGSAPFLWLEGERNPSRARRRKGIAVRIKVTLRLIEGQLPNYGADSEEHQLCPRAAGDRSRPTRHVGESRWCLRSVAVNADRVHFGGTGGYRGLSHECPHRIFSKPWIK